MQPTFSPGIQPKHLRLIAPRTRQQFFAYYLLLGNTPNYSAHLAGYAPTTANTNGGRMARNPKVQHLMQSYSRRLGLLTDDTLEEALQALHAYVASSKSSIAIKAAQALFKLSQPIVNNPHRNQG